MRTLILLSMSFFLLLEPREASAFARARDAMRSVFKGGANSRAATEANYPHCTSGNCHGNPFRNGPIDAIPQDNIASGVPRVLATLYGACDAAKPLNAINIDQAARRNSYNVVRGTKSRSQANANPDRLVLLNGVDNPESRVLRTVQNSEQFNRTGPYAAAMRGRVCRSNPGFNVSSTPKAFGYGAGGVMQNGEYNILRCGQPAFFNNLSDSGKALACGLAPDSKPTIALDCAEFIGAISIAGCKKLHQNQRPDAKAFKFPNGRELNTSSLVASSTTSGSCLTNSPTVSAASSIMPGDIFSGSESHAMMITKVGPDPLGINKARNRRGGCDSITYEDFDFDMAHSPGLLSAGPINSSAIAYARLYGVSREVYPLDRLRDMAKRLCRERSSGSSKNFIEDPKLTMLRHKGGEACSLPRDANGKCQPKLTGDSCADECGV